MKIEFKILGCKVGWWWSLAATVTVVGPIPPHVLACPAFLGQYPYYSSFCVTKYSNSMHALAVVTLSMR